MKLGLYSITYLGVWYRGRALTIEELIERAREYGYEGVEIDGKRPHGNPLDLPRQPLPGAAAEGAATRASRSMRSRPTTISAARSPNTARVSCCTCAI